MSSLTKPIGSVCFAGPLGFYFYTPFNGILSFKEVIMSAFFVVYEQDGKFYYISKWDNYYDAVIDAVSRYHKGMHKGLPIRVIDRFTEKVIYRIG